jgi:uncharacterized peroxidase-related enzyme
MTFIETVPEHEATGAVATLYQTDREAFGYLPNFTRGFSARPEVYAAWRALNGTIKANMELRHYELATIAAARRLRSSYCTLAHGSILLDKFLTREQLLDGTDLEPADRAIMELADKVVTDATSITPADLDTLRALGFEDADILDIVLAAAVRCFFSKVLDALGMQPDARFEDLEPGIRDTLTVGRPIAGS